MGTVNDWLGAIGGAILGIELIVLLVILVGINAGLAFGLRWVLRKTGMVHQKNQQIRVLVEKYVNRGAAVVASPVIVTTSVWRGLKAGLYRATHWPRTATPPALPRQAGSVTTPGPATPAAGDSSRVA